MNRTAMLKFATGSVFAALAIGVPSNAALAQDSGQTSSPEAANRAARAQQFIESGRADRAIESAEQAVAFAPGNSQYRVLLGQAYLSSGRFASAQASFDAARQLGANESRVIIGQALAMIANGRANEALQLVDANADSLPASDYGLALALAGQPDRGGMVLTDVVRSGTATARDRQNLALIYAISGRWLEARLIAGQDLGPQRVAARIEEWTAMLQAPTPAQRIAGLLGTRERADGGMPQRLALNGEASAPVMAAATPIADPAPIAAYAPPPPSDANAMVDAALADAEARQAAAPVAPVMTASAESYAAPVPVADAPAPAAYAPDAYAAEAYAPAPAAPVATMAANGVSFYSQPVIQQLRVATAAAVPATTAPRGRGRASSRALAAAGSSNAENIAPRAAAPVPMATRAPRGAVRTSGWAVQLGAYDSAPLARANWSRLASRHQVLASADGVSTRANVGGTTVFRLQATGFDSRGEADAACATVRRAGSQCFVRSMQAGEQVQWASRETPMRVASR